MDSTQYIKLDVMDSKIFDYIYTKQYDIGRTIVFTITKNGEQMNLSGLSAIFSMAKPDGNIILNSSTDDEIIINPDNTITLTLFDQITVLAGKLPYQISLLDGTKVVSTVTGYIYCDKAPVQREMAESVSAGSLMEDLAVVAQAIKDGEIHSGDIVSASADYNSGTKIGAITVNTVATNFYIPDAIKQELVTNEDSNYSILFSTTNGASGVACKNSYFTYNPDTKNVMLGTGAGYYSTEPMFSVTRENIGGTSTQMAIAADDISCSVKWDGEYGQYNSLHEAMQYLFTHIGDSQSNVNAIRVNNVTYDPVSGLVTLPPYPTTLPASNTTSVYNASGTAPVNGVAVASAIGALDGVVTGTAGAGKTLTALSQTDGVVSATFGDIAITTSQITNFPTLGTASTKDVPASGDASTTEVVMGDDTRLTDSRTPTAHTHGNIQNGGTLQTTDVAIANGDKLVVTDGSDSDKVARTSVTFDGTTDNKALTQKGTWEYSDRVSQQQLDDSVNVDHSMLLSYYQPGNTGTQVSYVDSDLKYNGYSKTITLASAAMQITGNKNDNNIGDIILGEDADGYQQYWDEVTQSYSSLRDFAYYVNSNVETHQSWLNDLESRVSALEGQINT